MAMGRRQSEGPVSLQVAKRIELRRWAGNQSPAQRTLEFCSSALPGRASAPLQRPYPPFIGGFAISFHARIITPLQRGAMYGDGPPEGHKRLVWANVYSTIRMRKAYSQRGLSDKSISATMGVKRSVPDSEDKTQIAGSELEDRG